MIAGAYDDFLDFPTNSSFSTCWEKSLRTISAPAFQTFTISSSSKLDSYNQHFTSIVSKYTLVYTS